MPTCSSPTGSSTWWPNASARISISITHTPATEDYHPWSLGGAKWRKLFKFKLSSFGKSSMATVCSFLLRQSQQIMLSLLLTNPIVIDAVTYKDLERVKNLYPFVQLSQEKIVDIVTVTNANLQLQSNIVVNGTLFIYRNEELGSLAIDYSSKQEDFNKFIRDELHNNNFKVFKGRSPIGNAKIEYTVYSRTEGSYMDFKQCLLTITKAKNKFSLSIVLKQKI